LLDANTTVTAQQNLNAANRQLNIIGLGSERTIQRSNIGNLFTVGAAGQANISLTIGNNLTLRGRNATDDGANNNNTVVTVQESADFIMESGSRITGNTSTGNTTGAAVFSDTGSYFTMRGGTITGNTNTGTSLAGGVSVFAGNLILEGGSISGNFGFTGDIYFSHLSSTFLSIGGNAEIGVLTLNANLTPSANAVTTIEASWAGNASTPINLNLRAGNAGIDGDTIPSWLNKTVLTGAGLDPITMGRFQLTNFISGTVTRPITGNLPASGFDNYKLELQSGNAVLVLD
jgi:hypothetical protein